jgi:hypothetical protein
LDAAKLQMENFGDGFYEQRFCEAGRTRDETVASSKETNEDLIDDFALADNRFAQLGVNLRARGDESFKELLLNFLGICRNKHAWLNSYGANGNRINVETLRHSGKTKWTDL